MRISAAQWADGQAPCARRGVAIAPLLSRERSCRQWVETIVAALSGAGWPGTRVEDSIRYQVQDRWHDILEDVASLDFAETRLPYEKFLGNLVSHAQSALFTPESQNAPISISGVLESAGRVYDAAWVLQVSDDAWPIRSFADAMLPHWLQAELTMPRGDAQQDARFSAAVLTRLQNSTGQLRLSYARESATGTLRPSPLIAAFEAEDMTPPAGRKGDYRAEAFEDLPAIAWPGAPYEAGGQGHSENAGSLPVPGLRGQAPWCPGAALFRTRTRRSTTRHPAAQRAADLVERSRMKSSAGLQALVADNSLTACIAEHVDKWLGRYAKDAGAWDDAYLQLERQRLCALIDSWLMLELDRPPFEVENTEQKKTVNINGLRLNIRLDRVDKLVGEEGNAGRILIDYKTGEVQASRWLGPRIEEPQLPLYAIAGEVEQLRDIFFAQLRPGKLCFTGSSAESQELVSVNATKNIRRILKATSAPGWPAGQNG